MGNAGRVLAVAALMAVQGCVWGFRHDTSDFRITLTDAQTGVPLDGVPIRVVYTYDSYQYLYVFNAPRDAGGATDGRGQVVLPVSDFVHGTTIRADHASIRLTPEQVRAGGEFELTNRGTANVDRPRRRIALERLAP